MQSRVRDPFQSPSLVTRCLVLSGDSYWALFQLGASNGNDLSPILESGVPELQNTSVEAV